MKILKKELELWNKVRKEVEDDFYIANTGIATNEIIMTIFEHKLKELRYANHAKQDALRGSEE